MQTSRNPLSVGLLGLALITGMVGTMLACGGGDAPAPKADGDAKSRKADRAEKGEKPDKGSKAKGKAAKADAPKEPVPSLLVVQAQFGTSGGAPKPLPAKLTLLRYKDGEYHRESFVDPDANVFHKAIAWRKGILTIGAERAPKKAHLKHWTRKGDSWEGEVLWEIGWEGAKFNRLRDLEIADVTGDGKENLVIATHDKGVVAVGTEAGGKWTFAQMDERPDTFVHEIEIGDVDGDGKAEFYATPSARNKASGESQPGSVWRYDYDGKTFKGSPVVDYKESHAKEILVTDLDGDGTDELYIVREGHTVKEGGKTKLVDPVKIERYTKSGGAWKSEVFATLDDHQCRFLLPGDVDGDGKTELIAAGFKSGLWLLDADNGTAKKTLIDANSGGFEHATHVADLDRDGKLEIYVAADEQKEFRQYKWNGTTFAKYFVGDIGPAKNSHITWNIQDGVF